MSLILMFHGEPTMTSTIRYFDGRISTPHPAHIHPVYYQGVLDGFVITWKDTSNTQQQKRHFPKDYEYLPAVDKAPHALIMSDGSKIEFLGKPPDWLPLHHQKLFSQVSHMEKHWKWVAVGIAVMCVLVVGLYRFGIPLAAHHIAHSLPQDILMEIGDSGENEVLEMTTQSIISQKRQDAITALYHKLDPNPKAKILIRGGGELGMNAVAIANNTIVITDELIILSHHDDEILAVLAHEQGHLTHRHTLEKAISSLGVGALIFVATGDVNSLLLTLPSLLTFAHYSQQAELEADKFAIDELKRLGISPIHLANILERMSKDAKHSHWSMPSTHPTTEQRIKQVKQNMDSPSH